MFRGLVTGAVVPQPPVLGLTTEANSVVLLLIVDAPRCSEGCFSSSYYRAGGNAAAATAVTQRELGSRNSPGGRPKGELLEAVAVRVEVSGTAVAEAVGHNRVLRLQESLQMGWEQRLQMTCVMGRRQEKAAAVWRRQGKE